MVELSLTWIKCKNNGDYESHWCNLVNLNKDNLDYDGVYIIWYPKGPIFRVGSGNINERLSKHANPKENFIKELNKKYNKNKINYDYKSLLVTFAKVNGNQMRGVEKYLGNKLKPAIGERFPDEVEEIEVNLPDL